MNISFLPLSESHFPFLLKWLEAPHVKAWWSDPEWTTELIQKKYANYVQGYKLECGVKKKIDAYIIYIESNPVGYIQLYNAYDFPRAKILQNLPKNLGAFDVFIGEESYLQQGIGSRAIREFLDAQSYSHVFADPEIANLTAIRAYEKAGFKLIEKQFDTGEAWMIREQSKE